MGLSRTELFTEDQNRMATIARAMAHPARIAILEYLMRTNGCVNHQLVEEIGLAQATVSQHLRELRDTGLIRGDVEGVKINYCIDPEMWGNIASVFAAFFDRYEDQGIKCC